MNFKDPESSGLPLHTASPRERLVIVDGFTKLFPLDRGWSEAILHPLQEEQVAAVNKVTLAISSGEIFGLLGPDGAGKSTLLRMLAGELPPDAGSATVAGIDLVRHGPEARRLVATEGGGENDLYPGLTVRENLRIFSRRSGRSGVRPPESAPAQEAGSPEESGSAQITGAAQNGTPRSIPRPVDEALGAAGLEDAADRPAGSLSPEARQRLLLARMLLFRPRLLLLDEPLRSLDAGAAKAFGELLRNEIVPREGCTVVLATHDPEGALALCDRVAVMDRGQVLSAGTPKELLAVVGDEWYRLWMRQVGLDSLMTLTGHRDIRGFRSHAASADGWTQVEVEIPGGLEAAARVLSSLARSGLRIARFERVGLSLPQLLDRLRRAPVGVDSSPSAATTVAPAPPATRGTRSRA